ncbi:DUF4124 domain-containing protein [Ideonella sp. DXS22W]|uniref:DUF4124 domain-containing protein n=1 Tax=Pseudaquabacterium inlustre TaxID=2984192 RepID=A0ABU9CHI2_9BURK
MPLSPTLAAHGLATRMTAVVLGLWLCAAAHAATVYRWQDDEGRVHYGETVPERYRERARAIDGPATAPSAQEQQQAQERARRDKARAAALGAAAATSAASAASAARAPASAASAPVPKRPARLPDERTDCATWQRLYQESLDCFAPYRTVLGGLKAEAFTRCNEVAEPPPTRCRMRTP